MVNWIPGDGLRLILENLATLRGCLECRPEWTETEDLTISIKGDQVRRSRAPGIPIATAIKDPPRPEPRPQTWRDRPPLL